MKGLIANQLCEQLNWSGRNGWKARYTGTKKTGLSSMTNIVEVIKSEYLFTLGFVFLPPH